MSESTVDFANGGIASLGGVKKKVTKKRRHIASSHEDKNAEDTNGNNGVLSPSPTESNKSDSDIMIIEHRLPDKSNASTNGAQLSTSSGPRQAEKAAASDGSQSRASSQTKPLSQVSSSQSIHVGSTSPNQQPVGSLTPPRSVEVARAQLEKQIKDALESASSRLVTTSSPKPDSKSPASSQQIRTPTPKAKKRYFDTRASAVASQFTWDTYLELCPALPAPREAFRHPQVYPKNLFTLGMRLEAKDPRNNMWCLAKVVFIEGLHLRLRFEGSDAMNDLHELVDSDNIRPCSDTVDELFPPTGFTGNIAQYPRYAEKILRDEKTIVAPKEIFPDHPQRPKRNMFAPGMKLEAVDRKNRDFICPATVGEVSGNEIKVMFDGWRGSFDYKCEYYSRDIFPINWCRDVGRQIQAPNGWQAMLDRGPVPPDFNQDLSGASQSTSKPVKSPVKTNRSANRTKVKKRGRTPKSNSPKKPPNKPKIYSSTPKSKSASSITNDHSYSSKLDAEVATKDSDDEEQDISDPFQCQRTVAFGEWKQKKLEFQMPQEESKSDTASMASTVPVTAEVYEDDVSQKVKKARTDDLEHVVASKSKKLSKWSVEDVIDVIKTEATLVRYAQVFQENEIDGRAFSLFSREKIDLLMLMGLKMGPVLKILDLREKIIGPDGRLRALSRPT